MKKIFLQLAILTGCLAASADNAHTIFFRPGNGWTNPYAYCYGGDTGTSMESGGPSQATYSLGNSVFVMSRETGFNYVIFTPVNYWGSGQSADIYMSSDLMGCSESEAYDNFSAGFYGNFSGSDKQLTSLTYISGTTYKTPSFTYASDVEFDFRTVQNDWVMTTATPGYLSLHKTTGSLAYSDTAAKITSLPVGTVYHLEVDFATGLTSLVTESLPASTDFTVYFDNSLVKWDSVSLYCWDGAGGNVCQAWPGTALTLIDEVHQIWSCTIPAADYAELATGMIFYGGADGARVDLEYGPINGELYQLYSNGGTFVDLGQYATYTGPETLYVIGTRSTELGWNGYGPGQGIEMAKSGKVYTAKGVSLVGSYNEGEDSSLGYFALTGNAASWDEAFSSINYVAGGSNVYLADGQTIVVTSFVGKSDNYGAMAWTVAPGTYDITFDWSTLSLTINSATTSNPGSDSDSDTTTDEDDLTIYYDNSASLWSQVYIHYWSIEEVGYTEWPGDKMTIFDAENNIWSYTIKGSTPPSSVFGIIFNGGSDATKSNDFYGDVIDGNVYKCGGNGQNVENLGGYEALTKIVYITDDELNNLQALDGVQSLRPYCVTATTVSGKVISISDTDVSGLDSTEPTYTWIKFEDVSSYTPKQWYASDNTAEEYQAYLDGGGDYWVDWAGNTHTDLSKRKGTLDSNHSTSHDCCNFSQAYYRCYLTTTEKVNPSLQSRKPRAVSVPSVTSRIAVTVPMSDNTTGIADILSDVDAAADGEPVYYNLQGVRIANPSAGIYIRVVGSRATKIALQ